MQYYFAPLEGLTDSIYRRLHHEYFPGVDKYFTPFFSPTVHRFLTSREERELPTADSISYKMVPQLLTKNAEDFLWMASVCRDRGYEEVNMNLGCPSGTVVSKGKGSGMLADPEGLNQFLDEIFSAAPLPISVKTRLGVSDPEEFHRLLEIFNQYPIQELTIHPRVRKDFYSAPRKVSQLDYAFAHSALTICINGDICTTAKAAETAKEYPQAHAIMIGRGLIGDPGMLSEGGTDIHKLEEFYNALLEEYLVAFGGSRNAMFRLKENWRYLLCRFEGSQKLGKQLRKTTDLQEYRMITAQIFHTLPLKDALEPDWLPKSPKLEQGDYSWSFL